MNSYQPKFGSQPSQQPYIQPQQPYIQPQVPQQQPYSGFQGMPQSRYSGIQSGIQSGIYSGMRSGIQQDPIKRMQQELQNVLYASNSQNREMIINSTNAAINNIKMIPCNSSDMSNKCQEVVTTLQQSILAPLADKRSTLYECTERINVLSKEVKNVETSLEKLKSELESTNSLFGKIFSGLTSSNTRTATEISDEIKRVESSKLMLSTQINLLNNQVTTLTNEMNNPYSSQPLNCSLTIQKIQQDLLLFQQTMKNQVVISQYKQKKMELMQGMLSEDKYLKIAKIDIELLKLDNIQINAKTVDVDDAMEAIRHLNQGNSWNFHQPSNTWYAKVNNTSYIWNNDLNRLECPNTKNGTIVFDNNKNYQILRPVIQQPPRISSPTSFNPSSFSGYSSQLTRPTIYPSSTSTTSTTTTMSQSPIQSSYQRPMGGSSRVSSDAAITSVDLFFKMNLWKDTYDGKLVYTLNNIDYVWDRTTATLLEPLTDKGQIFFNSQTEKYEVKKKSF